MGANGNKLTQHEWINRCNEIHNNKYDYSKAIYINKRTKIKIICSVHEEFEQLAGSHIKGDGCKKCASTKDSLGKSMSFNNFIKKANIIHGNRYNYNINTFKNGKTKTEITCLTHGIFYQLPQSHLQGIGCKKCNMFNPPLTTMQFIQKAFIKHGNKYDYSLVNYSKSYEKVCIICPIHGKFRQIANSHLCGSGCPVCNSSYGESLILLWLKENNINFNAQWKFENCKNIKSLSFDFYLPDQNICIEYDGEQHYFPIEYFGGKQALLKQKENDQIKTTYCLNNNIKLLRIPYWKKNNIKEILKEIL